tara:strand:+ start:109 stop:807 length:699 start_codon:yes stop_codon:yes gene_type:complete
MKKILTILFAAALALPALADDKGFVSIFDGKTLEGWNGDPKFWSVKDGAITGQTTRANPTRGNTFIIWEGGKTANFILEMEFKIQGGNSGIQYRSFKLPGNHDGWRIGGYQADFESGDRYSGILYGERFRGILSDRGFKTTWTTVDGKLEKKREQFGDSKKIGQAIKKGEWNKYHIEAKGYTFMHFINGVKTTEFNDGDVKSHRKDGLLALQLHAGPPMTVQFRNIRIKHLK